MPGSYNDAGLSEGGALLSLPNVFVRALVHAYMCMYMYMCMYDGMVAGG